MNHKDRTFGEWTEYFQVNARHRMAVDWDSPVTLTADERRAVVESIRQFQLGEGSDGRHFIALAERFVRNEVERPYVDALRLFIAEEQRHSSDLGRFLDREGVRRLTRHWSDDVFRGARKLLGLELCITVLISAEILAQVYYAALRDATESPVLKAVCREILHDEEAHIGFQGQMLRYIRRSDVAYVRRAKELGHIILLAVMGAAVWVAHRRVFLRGGRTVRRFLPELVHFGRLAMETARGVHREVKHEHEDDLRPCAGRCSRCCGALDPSRPLVRPEGG